MTPLPFVWPYWLLFWAAFVWAFTPEFRIVRKARLFSARAGSQDAGSGRAIARGMWLALAIAFPVAWVRTLRVPVEAEPTVFFAGIAALVSGSLLRRHCWRLLGASFTGNVRAHQDQPVVTTGAYAIVRHPSYSAGIMMNTGIGLALGSWASAAVLALTSIAVYIYRIRVEERVLSTVIGKRYRDFMRTRWRLVPYVY